MPTRRFIFGIFARGGAGLYLDEMLANGCLPASANHPCEQPDEPWTRCADYPDGARTGRLASMGFSDSAACGADHVPYGWRRFFFQNLTVLGDGSTDDERTLGARAWWQARLWPQQAHLALGVLWVFGFFVWINVAAVLGPAPLFLKMFSRSKPPSRGVWTPISIPPSSPPASPHRARGRSAVEGDFCAALFSRERVAHRRRSRGRVEAGAADGAQSGAGDDRVRVLLRLTRRLDRCGAKRTCCRRTERPRPADR